MEIKPSNVFYSHDSIMYRFRKSTPRSGIRLIGETLDDLCNGSCKVSQIPNIRITKKDGKWYTLDNRRLWVFHHYDAYLNTEGKSLTITADVVEYSPSDHDKRFTTKNGGVSIDIKDGIPWGKKQIKPVIPRVEEQKDEQKESGISVALEKRISETEEEERHITVTSCENIAPTDTTAGTTDKNLTPSENTTVTTDEMSATTVKIAATDDKSSVPGDSTTYHNGEISAPGDKTAYTNGENLVSTDTTANTTDKMLPAYTTAVHKGDILSLTDKTTSNTDEVTTTPSTSREMLATTGTNGITMGGISAPPYTIAISTDESSPTDEAADANGTSALINTTEGTTKCEIPLSELAKTTYGSEREEDKTRKRELSEKNTQFADDYLKVKRLKPNYE